MAKRTSRVVLNRQALGELDGALADGMLALATAIVDEADPPDATPFGVGLVRAGGAVVYARGRKTGEYSQDGSTVRKPRGLRTPKDQIVAAAGYGFPARFVELGTVDTHAQPFLTPAVERVLPRAPVVLSEAMARRLAGRRTAPPKGLR